MGKIRGLYDQFRHLIHEGAKFLVVGGIGTVLTFVVANALNGPLGKYGAVTVATVVATIQTFLGNRYWTFRHRQGNGTARETAMFFILNGVGLLIYYGCIWLIQDVADLKGKVWYNVALIVGTGLGTVFRFWSYRKWVWGMTDESGETAQGSVPGIAGPEHEQLSPAVVPAGRPDASASNGRPAARPHATTQGGRHAGAHRRH